MGLLLREERGGEGKAREVTGREGSHGKGGKRRGGEDRKGKGWSGMRGLQAGSARCPTLAKDGPGVSAALEAAKIVENNLSAKQIHNRDENISNKLV